MRAARELLSVVLLLAAVALAWCQSNAKWTAADWALPTAYGDIEHSDVLQHLAFIKAARDGDFVPFRSKIIPALGAPDRANWNDWPIVEEFQIYFAGLLARGVGLFAALNAGLLMGHLLAAGCFYLVARHLEVSLAWAFVGGLAFGLAPFLFAQSPHHPFVQWCWHLPLFVLVWRWVSSEPGVELGTRRFWFGLGVGLLAGFQMVYYTAIFAQLVLLGALVVFARTRRVRPLLSALAFLAAAAVAFAVMNLDTWMYRWAHGPNPDALVREFKWLEIYGLSVTNLFVPPLQHQWILLRDFAAHHAAERAQADEGSYLGLLGAASFLFLAGTSVVAVVRRRPESIPLEAWQVLWVILYFMSGGLNTLSGLFGFTLLRTGCRFSVVILVITLMFAAERLGRLSVRHRGWSLVLATALTAVALVDQVPRASSLEQRTAIAAQIASDRALVAAMESRLPKDAMIFQIPVMDFPEAPIPGVSPSDPLRPFLHSRHLRFSFGTDKGRNDAWSREVRELPIDQLVPAAREKGFSAILVNVAAFPRQHGALVNALRSVGCQDVAVSDRGDLICLRLP